MDIMMRLKGAGFSVISNEFRDREKRLGGGLPLLDFVEIVLRGLPRPKTQEEKLANINALVELFEDIDINGDGVMEFDEFTSFCVDAGMVAMRVKTAALKHRYLRNTNHVIKICNGCVGVEKVKWSPEFRKFLVLENTAKVVKLFDMHGKLIAEVGGASIVNAVPVSPRANDQGDYQPSGEVNSGQVRSRSPDKFTHTSLSAHGTSSSATEAGTGGNGTAPGIFILDAVFIFKFQWLAMSTTDFAISFYDMSDSRHTPLEHVLPNHASTRAGPRYELIKRLTITTTSAQLMLRFAEHSGLLFSSGNDFVLNVWKIIDSETKVLWKRLLTHQDMIMDVFEVPAHDLIVSCDLHKSIQLWDINDCRSRGALVGHTHGIKQLVYSSHHDLLLSAGFEFDAYGWDLGSRQIVMKLSGHRAPLVGIQLTLFQTERAVTADCKGVLKIWDISRNSNGAQGMSSSMGPGSSASQAIQLESIDPIQQFARFEPTSFICLHPHSRDLWVATAGSATLHLFQSKREQLFDGVPLRAFYHYNANKFIVVSGPICSVWDGETGACVEEFTHVGNIDSSHQVNGHALGGAHDDHNNHSATKNNNSHNGIGSTHGNDRSIEVLTCVQDVKCKKLVVVSENGRVGVFNCLNFVQMRHCEENFSRRSSNSNQTKHESTTTPSNNLSCGIVGLHYCSENKLIILADSVTSAIIVIDDNINADSAKGMKEISVLRRLIRIPGRVLASAYSYHCSLIAIVAEEEGNGMVVSLWDFETLSFSGHCEYQSQENTRGKTGGLHIVEFWEEFPVLIGADSQGWIYFFATMPLLRFNTGQLMHCFRNDQARVVIDKIYENGIPEMDESGSESHTSAGLTIEENGKTQNTFITQVAETAARKLLTKKNKRMTLTQTAGGTPPGHAAFSESGCAVTCMKVIYDESVDRYSLFTGDEAGVVRIWDLSELIQHLALAKIPPMKCKYLRRGYQPKAMFTRDFVRDNVTMQANGQEHKYYNRHRQAITQADWRSSLLLGEDMDSHFHPTQADLKRLSRRRLEAKKQSALLSGTMTTKLSSVSPIIHRTPGQQRAAAATAVVAAEAFLIAQQQKKSLLSLAGKTSAASKTRKRTAIGNSSFSPNSHCPDVTLLHSWQAHSDGLTSLEVTKNPNIIVTCALDMQVFVWNWQGSRLGKLFDAENIGQRKWKFSKDDSKRQAERSQLVLDLVRELELTPQQKRDKRRQTLYQEHVQRKSHHELRHVNTMLLDHIISKNPDLIAESNEEPCGGSGNDASTAINKIITDSECITETEDSELCTTKEMIRTKSLAQVGPLLCVNKFEYNSKQTDRVVFAEHADVPMDKQYLEQELSISFPGSTPVADHATANTRLSIIQSQVQQVHKVAAAAIENRKSLVRKSMDMYVNLEKAKPKAIKKGVLKQRQNSLEALHDENTDDTSLEPSDFLKRHLPSSALVLRPQTAPVRGNMSNSVTKKKQMMRTTKTTLPCEQTTSNQTSYGAFKGAAVQPGHANKLGSSVSDTALTTITDREKSNVNAMRKNSLDMHYIEEIKRQHRQIHSKGGKATADGIISLSVRKTAIQGGASSHHIQPNAGGERAADPSSMDHDDMESSLHKLRGINEIIAKAQEYCIASDENTAVGSGSLRPSTAPIRRASSQIGATLLPLNSIPTLCEGIDFKDEQNQDQVALVRQHLEETKQKMSLAMNDNERTHSRRMDLKKARRDAQQHKKAKRMEDYLEQKRREMKTNIGNVFKRTSFVFQSAAIDDPSVRGAIAKTAALSGATNAKFKKTAENATFGIYSIREVMSLIRLFWLMDEDGSGSISLEEMMQYKHFFEKLGYNDMATVFQAIDKDGNGHVSLKELLETCFHYTTKYQIEEMLKLAKVGNVKAYLQGDAFEGMDSNGDASAATAAGSLSSENRRELMDIFQVFDRNGDGGVSMDEIMEALRVDDDDVMAKVLTAQGRRKNGSNGWDTSSSGITREDVERLYREFDRDQNSSLDFDEFVLLMRSLYGPRSAHISFRL